MSKPECLSFLLQGNRRLTIESATEDKSFQVRIMVHQSKKGNDPVAALSTMDGLNYRNFKTVLNDNGVSVPEFAAAFSLAIGAEAMLSHCTLSQFKSALAGQVPECSYMPGFFMGLPRDVTDSFLGLANIKGDASPG